MRPLDNGSVQTEPFLGRLPVWASRLSKAVDRLLNASGQERRPAARPFYQTEAGDNKAVKETASELLAQAVWPIFRRAAAAVVAGDPPCYAADVAASASVVVPKRRCLAGLRASLVSVLAAPCVGTGGAVGRAGASGEGLSEAALNLLGQKSDKVASCSVAVGRGAAAKVPVGVVGDVVPWDNPVRRYALAADDGLVLVGHKVAVPVAVVVLEGKASGLCDATFAA